MESYQQVNLRNRSFSTDFEENEESLETSEKPIPQEQIMTRQLVHSPHRS